MNKIIPTVLLSLTSIFAESMPKQVDLGTPENAQAQEEAKPVILTVVDFEKAFAENDVKTVEAFLAQNKFTAKAALGEENITFLLTAVAEEKTDIARLLIQAGADVNVTTTVEQTGDDGSKRTIADTTPLMLAVNRRNPALVKMLIENGADTTMENEIGNTALDIANKIVEYGEPVGKDLVAAFETKPAAKKVAMKAPQP